MIYILILKKSIIEPNKQRRYYSEERKEVQGMSGKITEDQRKEFTMVKNSANHLLTLINDVIDVSKIETGKVELFIEEFNLADLMQGAKESFLVARSKPKASSGRAVSLHSPFP